MGLPTLFQVEDLAGSGCSRCRRGIPITRVSAPVGRVSLCLECTLIWFPGKNRDWFEERHAPYSDHVMDAILAGVDADFAALTRWLDRGVLTNGKAS